MKRDASAVSGALIPLLFAVAVLWLTPPVHAQECGKPPEGYGPKWAEAYEKWCKCMGGTLTEDAQGCTGIRDRGGAAKAGSESTFAEESAAASAAAAATAAEVEAEGERADAERKRDEGETRSREAERRRKDDEERQRKQEAFDRDKQKALRDMNAIAGELGLKSGGDALGLHAAEPGLGLDLRDAVADAPGVPRGGCTWGDQATRVVDLRCLGFDPDKPIAVDPNVVRGRERVFPAQIDPATFENRHYNDGFAALMRLTFSAKDAADAVASFRAARSERPRDPLVRNALLLAQDIVAARQQRERELQSSAAFDRLQAYAALLAGDATAARSHVARARKLEPGDPTTQFLESFAAADTVGSDPGRRNAYRLVANSLVAIRQRSEADAVRMLREARRLQSEDTFIAALLDELQKHQAGTGGTP
jgi:hypothetical protein